jgi:hypothetical protein
MSRQSQVFYIRSPDYTYLHSGVRCLFLLCHHLNRLGYEAYITGKNAPPTLLTPNVDNEMIAKNRRDGVEDIVIYPEIYGGNPLGGQKVVRYLLNKPGALNGVTIDQYGETDYVIHYADEFRDERLVSARLTIPLVDHTIFHRKGETRKRQGYVLYYVRYNPDFDQLPRWVNPYTIISRSNPRDPGTLAALYRQSKALVVWERTAAISEAIHCGCPVMVMPRPGFEWQPIVRRYFGAGFVMGWNKPWITIARGTIGLGISLYRVRFLGLDQAIHRFVRNARRHFRHFGKRD